MIYIQTVGRLNPRTIDELVSYRYLWNSALSSLVENSFFFFIFSNDRFHNEEGSRMIWSKYFISLECRTLSFRIPFDLWEIKREREGETVRERQGEGEREGRNRSNSSVHFLWILLSNPFLLSPSDYFDVGRMLMPFEIYHSR